MKILSISVLLLMPTLAMAQDKVWQTFGGGKAEISSYEVVEPRYGQPRKGHEVFIFVPEPFKISERIKPDDESSVNKNDLIHVMKLNRYHHFLTGVYPYNVMTTIQSALYEKANFKALDVLKMNIAAIEWCGNYFGEIRPRPKKQVADWEYFSYFEKEGRKSIELEFSTDGVFEDNLWIRIRELVNPYLAVGGKKEIFLYERLWQNRVDHTRLEAYRTSLSKVSDSYQGVSAFKWSWDNGSKKVDVWVDRAYPHYILGWKDSLGGSGSRLATVHIPYWKKSNLEDEEIRKQLKLPF